MGDLQEAIRRHATSEEFREDYLWPDLAWLESCHLQARTPRAFERFCDSVREIRQYNLERWYLQDSPAPAPVPGTAFSLRNGRPADGWEWHDPLGRCELRREGDDVFALVPAIGVGIFSNVHVPRLLRAVEGDFSTVVCVQGAIRPTGAGGILVYADDDRLLRLGAGIHFDREVTLTKKTASGRLSGAARGLARTDVFYLRLDRRGDDFTAWRGDSSGWRTCGTIRFDLPRRLHVGAYAECTYRMFSLRRGEAHPFRITELSVGQLSSV